MNRTEGLAALMATGAWLHAFGEPVTYTISGQSPREIRAVVRRRPIGPRGPTQQKLEYAVEIYVTRQDIPQVTIHTDTVRLRRLPGDTGDAEYQVVRIIGTEGGMWKLGLN